MHQNIRWIGLFASISWLMSPSLGHAQELSEIALTNLDDHESATVVWADFNADGQQDFFISGVTDDAPLTLNTQVFLNFGTLSPTPINDFTALSNVSVSIADFNFDGFPDIAMMGSDELGEPQTIIYSNDSGTGFTAESFGIDDLEQGYILWWDADHDGDLDLLQSGRNASATAVTKLWVYEEGSYSEQSTDLPALAFGAAATADFNGDGWMDVLLTGTQSGVGEVSDIFINDQDYTFTALSTGFTAVSSSAVAIGDYNEDGEPDVALSGLDGSANKVAALYENDGDLTFTEVAAGITAVSQSSVAFGDLNNDGLSDLIITGVDGSSNLLATIYRNTASTYTLTAVQDTLLPMVQGNVALADFDNDGDQDVLQSGLGNVTRFSKVYRNTVATSNTAPDAPAGLNATTREDSVFLSWSAATDDATVSASLTYAVYVGTATDTFDIIAPGSELATGYRRINGIGNAGWSTALSLHGLPEGEYFWSVQAIDANGLGSAFASEDSFGICYSVDLGADSNLCLGDTLALSVGESGDVVNWYSTQDGLLQSSSLVYNHPVSKQDTLFVEVTKPQGCTVVDTLIVSTYALPTVSVGNDTAACDGEVVNLSVTPGGWEDTDWFSLREGAVAANTEAYNRQVSQTDTVFARVEDANGCVNTDTLVVGYYALPTPEVGANDTLCLGDTLTLSVSPAGWGAVSWYSSRRDSVVSTLETPAWAVLETDTLSITVTDANGCQNSDTLQVVGRDLPDLTMPSDQSGCLGDTLEVGFEAPDWAMSWWYYETMDSLLTTNVDSLLHPVNTEDTLLVTIQDAFGCENSGQLIVLVDNLPDFTVGNDTTICLGETVTLATAPGGWQTVSWATLLGDTLETNSFFYDFLANVETTLVSTATDDNGCVNTDTIQVSTFSLPTPDVGSDTLGCFGDTLTLAVSPGGFVSVMWTSLVEGNIVGTAASLDWEIDETDTLVATVEDANGCNYSDSLRVESIALPDFSAGSTLATCIGESATLAVNPGGWAQVDWYAVADGGLVATDTDTYTITATDTVSYLAEVTDANGCLNRDTVQVNTLALPLFTLGSDTSTCFGESMTLQVDIGWDEVNWYLEDGTLLASDAFFVSFNADSTVNVVAEVYNANRCVQYDTVLVTVLNRTELETTGTESVCIGDTLITSVNDAAWTSVSWQHLDPLVDTVVESDTLQWVVTDTSYWEVTVVDSQGCSQTDSLSVYPLALPQFEVAGDTSLCLETQLALSVDSSAVASVSWYLDGGLFSTTSSIAWEVSDTANWRVEVTDTAGCFNDASFTANAMALPTPSLGADTATCEGTNILFNMGSSSSQFDWYEVGIASPLDTNTFFYIHPAASDQTIVVAETDENGCVATDSVLVSAYALPSPDLGVDQEICLGDTVSFANSLTGTSTAWYVDGDLAGNASSFDFVASLGISEIVLEATNAKGCLGYDTVRVTSLNLPSVDLGSTVSFCAGSTLTRTLSGLSVDWYDGAGTLLLYDSAVYSTTVTEGFTLMAQATNALGCMASDTLLVTLRDNPEVDLGADVTLCVGDTLALSLLNDYLLVSWYKDGTDTAIVEDSFDFSEVPTISSAYYAEVLGNNGCTNRDTVQVTVNALPTAEAGSDVTFCQGQEVQLGMSPVAGQEYAWSPGIALSDSTASNPRAQPVENQTYVLQVTSALGCEAYDTVAVTISSTLTVNAGVDVALCKGESITLGGNPTASGSAGDYQYQWLPATGLNDPTAANPTASPLDSTTYRVIVQSEDCPMDTAEVRVAVLPLPEVVVPADTGINSGQTIVLTAEGGFGYLWSPANRVATGRSAATMTSVELDETTLFQVIVTNEYGCQAQGEVTVFVLNEIFVPELFSPNADGSNDVLTVLGDGIQEIDFRVYDRSGTQVYRATTVMQAQVMGWDGTLQGQDAPVGDYFWSLQGTFQNGQPLLVNGQSTGRIRLIR